jgi:catechol 2,3-dioxygenase-like lactoylglutathione lyase family enzyme
MSDFKSGVIGIGVVVADLEKSMDFYTGVIGMVRTGAFDMTGEFGASSGLTGGLPFHVEVLKLADSPDATSWKLISFKGDARPLPEHIQDETGMRYITIQVNSLDPLMERLKRNGVRLLGNTPTPMPDGKRHFVLVQDPDGTFIELIGPLEQATR